MLDDDDDSDCEEGFRITSDMMSRLDNSSWLKKELSDGGLRQILCDRRSPNIGGKTIIKTERGDEWMQIREKSRWKGRRF